MERQEEQNKDQDHDESGTRYVSFALLDAVAAGDEFVPIKGNGGALLDENADIGYGGEHADGSHANACGLQFRSRKQANVKQSDGGIGQAKVDGPQNLQGIENLPVPCSE